VTTTEMQRRASNLISMPESVADDLRESRDAGRVLDPLVKLNDFALRSCWNCNPSHEHLKRVAYVIRCFECWLLYYKGEVVCAITPRVFRNRLRALSYGLAFLSGVPMPLHGGPFAHWGDRPPDPWASLRRAARLFCNVRSRT
jgi:hypothetical protein